MKHIIFKNKCKLCIAYRIGYKVSQAQKKNFEQIIPFFIQHKLFMDEIDLEISNGESQHDDLKTEVAVNVLQNKLVWNNIEILKLKSYNWQRDMKKYDKALENVINVLCDKHLTIKFNKLKYICFDYFCYGFHNISRVLQLLKLIINSSNKKDVFLHCNILINWNRKYEWTYRDLQWTCNKDLQGLFSWIKNWFIDSQIPLYLSLVTVYNGSWWQKGISKEFVEKQCKYPFVGVFDQITDNKDYNYKIPTYNDYCNGLMHPHIEFEYQKPTILNPYEKEYSSPHDLHTLFYCIVANAKPC